MYSFSRYFWLTGLRRSGNHALQTWLLGPFGDRALKLNYTVKIEGRRLAQLRAKYVGPDMTLIQGAERLNELKFEMPPMVMSKRIRQIIILRNPLNNIASQARLWGTDYLIGGNAQTFLRRWLMYAREFVGDTNVLPNKVTANFDRWFAEEQYRRDLAKRLDIPFSDATLNQVDPDWGKSSFDYYDYDGRAQELKVLDRWREFVGTPQMEEFVRRFRDHGAFHYFLNIYGELPEELAVHRRRRYDHVEA